MPSIGPGTGTITGLDIQAMFGSHLVGWYEADWADFTISAGTLARWRDRSSRRDDWIGQTNPTVGLGPNGLPVVTFATNQYMTRTGNNLAQRPLGIFVVCQTSSTTDDYVLASSPGGVLGADPALISRFVSLGMEWYGGTPRLTSIASATAGVWHLASITSPGGPSVTMTAWGDGAVGETGDRGNIGGGNSWNLGTAHLNVLGSSNGAANFYNGSVASIIITDLDLTGDPRRVILENYLCARRGIARANLSTFSPQLVWA